MKMSKSKGNVISMAQKSGDVEIIIPSINGKLCRYEIKILIKTSYRLTTQCPISRP